MWQILRLFLVAFVIVEIVHYRQFTIPFIGWATFVFFSLGWIIAATQKTQFERFAAREFTVDVGD